ncbi:MAG: flagellar biosynthesis protein FlhA [Planctomycetota bacterium JB042]
MSDDLTKDRGQVRGELGLVVAVALMLSLLVLPLPAGLLDVLLACNITFTLLVLFTVIATPAPREFTSFPSLLLFLTLYRLGLNVASSRLILLEGNAGEVIDAFGNFVVGGNLVVGIIVFSILLIVQFVVITKGAGRISEVAARFTLDGLPGKQMAIDADLNAGIIDGDQARERRDSLMKESEFYGAMDGASKFVRGDAVAGLIITVVNLLGGAILGLAQGMSVAEAVRTYSILTIGDGLVAQVPALIVSISGALLVTKSSAEASLPTEFGDQLFSKSRTFVLVSTAALGLGVMPGLPALPFVLLAGSLFVLGRIVRKKEEAARQVELAPPPPPPRKSESDQIEELLTVDRLLVEVGYRLVGLVQSGPTGSLLDRISQLRKRFASEIGIVLPPVRVRDSASLDPGAYRVLLGGEEIAAGSLSPGCALAMPPGEKAEPIQGVLTRDPTFGLPAYWIREDRCDEAEAKGYTVVEASAVLATHLSEVFREHAHEILTRDDTKARIEQLKETAPALVEEVTPGSLSLGDVHKVLRNLLREGVGIRNLAPIFETIADHAPRTKDADVLGEFVRERFARSISARVVDDRGTLVALTLDPALEQSLADLSADPNQLGIALRQVVEQVRRAAEEANAKGRAPTLVVRPTLRRVLALPLLDQKPKVPVVSYSEIVGVENIEPVSVIRIPGSPVEVPA